MDRHGDSGRSEAGRRTARLKELGYAKRRSTHWMVKEAVVRYLDTEEGYEREKAEDLDRWERYVESGDAVSHETVMAWLDDLAVEADRRACRR